MLSFRISGRNESEVIILDWKPKASLFFILCDFFLIGAKEISCFYNISLNSAAFWDTIRRAHDG